MLKLSRSVPHYCSLHLLFDVQVTQSTVDKYLDDILLTTVYTVAHEDTLMEMGIHPDTLDTGPAQPQEGGRRASAASTSTGGEKSSKEKTAVKQRMKATQKKYLSAAHDQIWGMLDQFKKKGEVSSKGFHYIVHNILIQMTPDNVKEIEKTIRGSVNDILDKDKVEVDLKNSVSNLDINWSV